MRNGIEGENVEAELSFGWEDGSPVQVEPGLERLAAYSVVFARTLTAAGYTPRRLDVGLRRGKPGDLELHVRGDVPGIPEADFLSLARITLHSFRFKHGLTGDEEPQIQADLATPAPAVPSAVPAPAPVWLTRVRELRESVPLVRI